MLEVAAVNRAGELMASSDGAQPRTASCPNSQRVASPSTFENHRPLLPAFQPGSLSSIAFPRPRAGAPAFCRLGDHQNSVRSRNGMTPRQPDTDCRFTRSLARPILCQTHAPIPGTGTARRSRSSDRRSRGRFGANLVAKRRCERIWDLLRPASVGGRA